MDKSMTSEELQKLAASEHGWVESRAAVYEQDGAPIPEPVRRLRGLCNAVLAFLPGLGAQMDHRDAVAAEKARADRAESQLRRARVSLYSIGELLDDANAQLDAMAGTETLAESVAPTDEGARVRADVVGVARTDAMPSPDPGASLPSGSGSANGSWPASGLFHGLVLVNDKGDRRLFSESVKGAYQVQTVAADGLSAGEPWSTLPEKWSPEEWRQAPTLAIKPALRRYDEELQASRERAKPAKPSAESRTLALPGMVDAVPPRKTLADFHPDYAQFATWTKALAKAASANPERGEVTDQRVRELFVSWQAANATEEKPNPAAAFWHHARGVIVGNTAAG